MRNIQHVLGTIIPFVENDKLKAILESNLDSTYYAAPELIPRWWQIVTQNLNAYVAYPPVEDWEYSVLSVWLDKGVRELREEFQGGDFHSSHG